MPATLTTPTAQPTVPVLHHGTMTVDFETGLCIFTADQCDNANPPNIIGPLLRGSMAWSAFTAAYTAASGNAKQKGYTVLLAALGLSASAIT
jgi:hypothetical protein